MAQVFLSVCVDGVCLPAFASALSTVATTFRRSFAFPCHLGREASKSHVEMKIYYEFAIENVSAVR
jgi:hypothetical protein